ncbi:hypothetical protein TRFO_03554 [Tritrichomonas foetus]|uniref:Uncharacterized protein n=1 Tax=Tritrichomonas foetus TaxID=1144522 RepID=A0A1J4KRW0_9EUKA|nr:hypothetical protein TRFO_03554 [Tritrichomonas foetus]|eukprot:OHT12556.1 hypothetical protein TRFO_03554 [Tritrichomonas foetus]
MTENDNISNQFLKDQLLFDIQKMTDIRMAFIDLEIEEKNNSISNHAEKTSHLLKTSLNTLNCIFDPFSQVQKDQESLQNIVDKYDEKDFDSFGQFIDEKDPDIIFSSNRFSNFFMLKFILMFLNYYETGNKDDRNHMDWLIKALKNVSVKGNNHLKMQGALIKNKIMKLFDGDETDEANTVRTLSSSFSL